MKNGDELSCNGGFSTLNNYKINGLTGVAFHWFAERACEYTECQPVGPDRVMCFSRFTLSVVYPAAASRHIFLHHRFTDRKLNMPHSASMTQRSRRSGGMKITDYTLMVVATSTHVPHPCRNTEVILP
ncbi:hypothetical protein [Klebsiella aerogenes]|uniref:hypothetical protein n=1 Tax=Klebsiella aerogenes TaxID=548 RepID=UPI001F26364C|nr:hypothetical protein [Klebsiella aerogenes]